MFDRRHLSPEERAEYDALLYEAGYDSLDRRRPSSEIADHVHDALLDAIQAGRTWAQYVLDDDARKGHLARFKQWDKVRDVIQVSSGDMIVPRAAAMGVKKKEEETGATYWQLTAWDEMTWDQVTEVMKDAQARIASERITVAMAVRLLKLHTLAPSSTGPGEACAQIGTTVKEFLAADEAA